jgi:lysophospholipase L1-like esterase
MKNDRDAMLRPDGVHFVAEAEEKLGRRVAEVIREHL